VSISGDTIVVGAYGEDNPADDCGAAYVFGRNHGGPDAWGQIRRLTASNAEDNDNFGFSVAISGDVVVVGAPYEDGGVTGLDRGMAYVFERNEGGKDNWGQVTYLTSGHVQDSTYFGYSVSISVDTVIVGAHGVDGADPDSGAAYIFTRNKLYTDDWGRVKTLTGSDAQENSKFGFSVSISGEMAVVGAYGLDSRGGNNTGAAYLFERNHGGTADNWGQVKKLTASDAAADARFGYSVAIGVDMVVAGAEGDDGAGTGRGAAYVLARNQGGADNWGQVSKLTASDTEDHDHFGGSVAISGDTAIVGAAYEDGAGTNQGTAYLFVAGEGQWPEVAKPQASDAADEDRYGLSVSISGDLAVVGADWEDGIGGSNRGAAYILERNQGGANNWGQVTKLAASDAADDDYFGRSVAISGDTVVVGAWGKDDVAVYLDHGAAYIFTRNQDGADSWGQVKRLTAEYSADDDIWFGFSVAISGDTVVVGAWGEKDSNDVARGAAYIFERNHGGTDAWGRVAKLTGDYSLEEDHFGYSVAISNDTVVVGAWGEDGGTGSEEDRGAAYVFERNKGGAENWGLVKKLGAFDAADNDRFGTSVAISGDTIVIGADLEDGADPASNCGAAYLFERNHDLGTPSANNWGQVAKLTALDAEAGDSFGASVAISGDIVVVGAHQRDGGLFWHNLGAAYLFERNENGSDNWGQVNKLRASDAANQDYFGRSVAISDNKIIVGAYGENGEGLDWGAAYIYYRWESLPEITVSPASLAFGDWGVDAGPSSSRTVTIANDGDGDLQISSVGLSGADAAEFAIESDSLEDTLAPGGLRTIQVSFDPSSEGAKAASLSIVSDDGDEPTVNVALSGNGVSLWRVFLPMVRADG
jgi:hypothetical protein